MKYLFIDESGDHNLFNIDPHYPLFILAGCIMDERVHEEGLRKSLSSCKREQFSDVNVILHYVDYTRNKSVFKRMQQKAFREKFYSRLNTIIKETNFVLLSCIINKEEHKKRYGMLAIDPYILSLEIIIERFILQLINDNEKGIIIAESRGKQLDNELELAFLNIKIKGTRFLRPKDITDNISNFLIKKKEENIAGLQLADSIVTPIGRKYLNKINYYIDYDIIKSKFRKSKCGKYKGYGLVILPK